MKIFILTKAHQYHRALIQMVLKVSLTLIFEPGDSDYEDYGHSSSEEICISEIEAIFER